MRIGIMQGRLVPPEGGRFQSFPQAWREEFVLAQAAGIDYIEWIVDSQPNNPVFSTDGLYEMQEGSRKYNVAIPAICADWFMEHPLREDFSGWKRMLIRLQLVACVMGIRRIIIPFVDNSSMQTMADVEIAVRALENTDDDTELHLETDLAPTLMAEFLARLPPHCKANWDSGNSSGLGYMASEEFAAYGDRIGSIHIKDRYRKPGGGVETQELGNGSANFCDVFAAIDRIGYDGDFTLQVARGVDGDEVQWIRKQADFVRKGLHAHQS